MPLTICLFANTINYLQGGGHLWEHLNYALGLRALGCKVIWHERVAVNGANTPEMAIARIEAFKSTLRSYGLEDCLSASTYAGEALPREVAPHCLSIEAAAESDLLLNFVY